MVLFPAPTTKGRDEGQLQEVWGSHHQDHFKGPAGMGGPLTARRGSRITRAGSMESGDSTKIRKREVGGL